MGCGQPFTRVRDLDAEGVADHVERESEVAAVYPAVCGRVGRQLGDDVPRRVQWQSPCAQLLGCQEAGEAGSAWCGGQSHAEVADGADEFGVGGDVFRIHVTQRGGACLR